MTRCKISEDFSLKEVRIIFNFIGNIIVIVEVQSSNVRLIAVERLDTKNEPSSSSSGLCIVALHKPGSFVEHSSLCQTPFWSMYVQILPFIVV